MQIDGRLIGMQGTLFSWLRWAELSRLYMQEAELSKVAFMVGRRQPHRIHRTWLQQKRLWIVIRTPPTLRISPTPGMAVRLPASFLNMAQIKPP